MMRRLLPTEIALFWDSIKHGYFQTNPLVEKADPFETSKNLLFSLLTEKFHCWICYTKEGEKQKIHGFLITTIRFNNSIQKNYVHIVSLYGFRKFPDSLIDRMAEDFYKFCRSNDCAGIRMETSNKRVMSIVERLGWKRGEVNYYHVLGDEHGERG